MIVDIGNMLRGKRESCDKHHTHSLVKSSTTAILNVKTAELAPVNGCDAMLVLSQATGSWTVEL